jgi:hypothetical protein
MHEKASVAQKAAKVARKLWTRRESESINARMILLFKIVLAAATGLAIAWAL